MRTPLILLLLLLPLSAAAQQPPATSSAADPGADLVVSILTMGPGDEIYEKFGHNALVIEDRRTGRGDAFNYGIFAFDSGFIGRFLEGNMMYWMQPDPLHWTLNFYANVEDRTLSIQELNLTPAQRRALWDHLEWNQREENKHYLYNYYNSNCSTKLRDAVDTVLGGQIAAQLKARPTATSYRWHTRRCMAYSPIMYTALDFVLGPGVDRGLTAWDESFLPEELMKHLRTVTITDDAGNRRPLVAAERQLRQSTRFASRPSPPTWWPAYLFVGCATGGLLAWLGRRTDRRASRWGFLTLATLWSLLAGIGGLFLCYGFTTTHWAVHWNENILQSLPVALALIVLAPAAAMGKPWAQKPALLVAALVAVTAVLGLTIQVLPAFNQVNGAIIAIMLPANLGLWWGIVGVVRTRRRTVPAPAVAKLNPAGR